MLLSGGSIEQKKTYCTKEKTMGPYRKTMELWFTIEKKNYGTMEITMLI